MNKDRAVVMSLGVILPGVSAAAVDAAVSTGITSLEADAATLAAIVSGVVLTITFIVLGIRLYKRVLMLTVK